MPTPNDGESHDDFIDRCVPEVIEDGAAETPEQAVAICESLWEQNRSAPTQAYSPADFMVSPEAIDEVLDATRDVLDELNDEKRQVWKPPSSRRIWRSE